MPRNEPKPRKAWEVPAALLCGAGVWLDAISQGLTMTRANAPQPIFPILLYIVGTAFGIGFAISALRCGGGKNRLFATLALVIIAAFFVPPTFLTLLRFLSNYPTLH